VGKTVDQGLGVLIQTTLFGAGIKIDPNPQAGLNVLLRRFIGAIILRFIYHGSWQGTG
jgi:hypothetical protein